MAEINQIIKTARDILVGKVPNPQSQVEQITIAIMYKLMDIKDKEAIDYGGVPSFFAGDYAEYSFTSIMNTPNNMEKLTKYRTGLEKMGENLGLSQMFRTVFRGAYLPYNDAATLAMFLKEIDKIPTDNSEVLGTAFEDLLSIMSSQGDAGQFRTPRHLINMIVEIVEPKKGETILDPACGTAGFLVSAFNFIYNGNKNNIPGDTLTIDEKSSLMNNINGYDISPEMVKLSKVNMYLHGFNEPKIAEYDTLTDKTNWKQYYDVIFANPPFMSPKGGIRPHKLFRVDANRSEVLFVDYIAEHLNKNGRGGVIVPEGIVFQSANAYKQLRKFLVDDCVLYAVISLPAGVFNPYSGVKTSILLFDKAIAKSADNILFVKIDNDGFDLGAQRREIKDSDIPRTIELIKKYKSILQQGGEFTISEYEQQFTTVAPKKRVAEQDYTLVGERYKEATVNNTAFPLVELGEVCEINPPKPKNLALKNDALVSFVPMSDLSQNSMYFILKEERRLEEVIDKYTYFTDNDVILAKVTPCFENGKIGIAKGLKNQIGFGSSEYYIIRPNEKILDLWIYLCLLSDRFRKLGKESMTGTGGLQRIPKDFIRSFKIPLPPLFVQELIVAEIGGYQKIIDGAKQVVDNYKPTIKIDSKWEIMELSNSDVEIIDGDRGTNYPSKEEFSESGYCLFLNTSNVRNGFFNFDNLQFISKDKDEKLRKGKLKRNDVILTTRGTVGNVAYYSEDIPYDNLRLNSGMVILRPDTTKISSEYLLNLFLSTNIEDQIMNILSGAAQPQLPIRSLNTIKIPLPPLEIQKQIVRQINDEQKSVDECKKLIAIFGQKIKDKISEVWGE